jgi:hypothetical protein
LEYDVPAARYAMENAADYKTWHEAAAELDPNEGLDEWKQEKASED